MTKEEAESVMTEALHDYGLYKSKGLGTVTNALEGMLNQSSRNGMFVFDQEFKALSEDYAEKHIKNCPHSAWYSFCSRSGREYSP